MVFYLYRTRTRPNTTDGVLCAANGRRICDTAEHTPTMLPRGEYTIVLKQNKKYGHRAPWVTSRCPSDIPLQNPPTVRGEMEGGSFKGGGKIGKAFILHGNGVYAKRFGATIIVGEHFVPGVVINSRHYFDLLLKRIEKALMRGNTIELIIR